MLQFHIIKLNVSTVNPTIFLKTASHRPGTRNLHNYSSPTPKNQPEIRELVRKLCQKFPGEYWRDLDQKKAYPLDFVKEWSKAGLISMQIPEDEGGMGLGLESVAVALEEAQRSGCNASAVHAQLYQLGTIMKLANDKQRSLLPSLANGSLRLQAFGVTEPSSGSDTASLQTRAVKVGNDYKINGSKIWTSRALYSDLMLILARTSPPSNPEKRHQGLSLFLVDIHDAVKKGQMQIIPISTMINHSTTQVYFEDLIVPSWNMLGQEGKGFEYILSSMNAERILIAAECIGDGRYGIDKAIDYAKDRIVFGKPIGTNQGISLPIADAYAKVESAASIVLEACKSYDEGIDSKTLGSKANIAKYLASHASFNAMDVCLQTHGGMGFACDMDVERKWRETRLYRVAPISDNLVLSFVAEKVLGLPRSY